MSGAWDTALYLGTWTASPAPSGDKCMKSTASSKIIWRLIGWCESKKARKSKIQKWWTLPTVFLRECIYFLSYLSVCRGLVHLVSTHFAVCVGLCELPLLVLCQTSNSTFLYRVGFSERFSLSDMRPRPRPWHTHTHTELVITFNNRGSSAGVYRTSVTFVWWNVFLTLWPCFVEVVPFSTLSKKTKTTQFVRLLMWFYGFFNFSPTEIKGWRVLLWRN